MSVICIWFAFLHFFFCFWIKLRHSSLQWYIYLALLHNYLSLDKVMWLTPDDILLIENPQNRVGIRVEMVKMQNTVRTFWTVLNLYKYKKVPLYSNFKKDDFAQNHLKQPIYCKNCKITGFWWLVRLDGPGLGSEAHASRSFWSRLDGLLVTDRNIKGRWVRAIVHRFTKIVWGHFVTAVLKMGVLTALHIYVAPPKWEYPLLITALII